MSGHLLYIVGQPGSGKSTLAAALTAGLEPVSVELRPFAHVVWGDGIVELGAHREKFSGTDALSMSVQPKVLRWLQEEAPPFVLGEGDRLANLGFLKTAQGLGYSVAVAFLAVSDAVAEHRRQSRVAAIGGQPQNPTWVRGRISKARNLMWDWPGTYIGLDADQPPASVVAQLRSAGNPVVERLAALVASPS